MLTKSYIANKSYLFLFLYLYLGPNKACQSIPLPALWHLWAIMVVW